MADLRALARELTCPTCTAPPGARCGSATATSGVPHADRLAPILAAYRAGAGDTVTVPLLGRTRDEVPG